MILGCHGDSWLISAWGIISFHTGTRILYKSSPKQQSNGSLISKAFKWQEDGFFEIMKDHIHRQHCVPDKRPGQSKLDLFDTFLNTHFFVRNKPSSRREVTRNKIQWNYYVKSKITFVLLYIPFHETTEDIESDSKIGQIDIRYYTHGSGVFQWGCRYPKVP